MGGQHSLEVVDVPLKVLLRDPVTHTRPCCVAGMLCTSFDDFSILFTRLTAALKRLLEFSQVKGRIAGKCPEKILQDVGQITDFGFESSSVLVLALIATYELIQRDTGFEGDSRHRQDTSRGTEGVHLDKVCANLMARSLQVGYDDGKRGA